MGFKRAYAKDRKFGTMCETDASLKRHIASEFGFQISKIRLMDAGCRSFMQDGMPYIYFDQASFQVCGKGYATCASFSELVRAPQYDA